MSPLQESLIEVVSRWFVFSRPSDIMSSHIVSCHIMSCHVILCRLMLCHIISSRVMSCRVPLVRRLASLESR